MQQAITATDYAYKPAMTGYNAAVNAVFRTQATRVTVRLRVMRLLKQRKDARFEDLARRHEEFSYNNAFNTQILLRNLRREYLGI